MSHIQLTSSAPQGGIGYAPPLLPDELIYSWLARLAALNALGTPRECLQRLFGCGTMVPSIDLPTRLLAVQHQLGSWLPFRSVEELIDGGTLLPYYRPFLTSHKHASARQAMLQGDGKGLKTKLGLVANRFGAKHSLRWCSDCMADGIAVHGSPHWARRHQLPGVNCCAIHGIALHSLPPTLSTNKQKLVVPPRCLAPESRIQADPRQIRFATLSAELLSLNMPVISAGIRAATYQQAALRLAYRSRRGRVDHRALAASIRQHHAEFDGFDHRERLLATSAQPLSWIRDLMERPDRAVHPVCHLILIEFLFGSVAAFRDACCLNQATQFSTEQKRTQSLVTAEPAQSASDAEELLRDVSKSCRQLAALLGRSVTTIVAHRRRLGVPIKERRKTLTPSVIEAVRRELGMQIPLPVVAIRTGVSIGTVYRILAEHPSDRQARHDRQREAEAATRRQRWIRTLASCEGSGASGARNRAPADYAWLYRNDRAWLAATTQPANPSRKPQTRVNWAKRDAQLCEQMHAHLATLQSEIPPVRISRAQLLRPLGETMVRKNLQRLPKLQLLLKEWAEPHEMFRRRRVAYAVAVLAQNGSGLQPWRIRKLAGVRVWSDALAKHAAHEVNRLNVKNPLHTDALP